VRNPGVPKRPSAVRAAIIAAADAAHGISPRRHPIAAWLTTTDHKKIGILYMATAWVFLLIGGVEALIIRTRFETDGNMYEIAEALTALGFPVSARLVGRVLVDYGLSKKTG
jgi:hypothetical protein